MSYIGVPPQATFSSGLLDRFTSTTGTTVTLTHDIASENDIVVFVNFVKQDSTTYSVGGTGNKTLTLGGTLVSSDIDEVHYLNIVGQTNAPSSGSVGSSQLTTGAVTGAKLNTDVISAQTELASGVASTDELLISDGGVLKRVDVSLVGGTNSASFCAINTSGQTGISSGTMTKMTFNSEDFDTDSAFDLSNDKFICPSDGKYFFGSSMVLQATLGSGYFSHGKSVLYKNGSSFATFGRADDRSDNNSREFGMDSSIVVDASANDYFEMYSQMYTDSGTWLINHGDKGHRFFGFKLIT